MTVQTAVKRAAVTGTIRGSTITMSASAIAGQKMRRTTNVQQRNEPKGIR